MPFFYPTSPIHVLFCQIRVSCQTFKMVIQRCYLNPDFLPFKPTGHVRNHVFSLEEGKNSLFSIQPTPRVSCFC